MQKGFVIAIDGPVAAGKGTVAPALAVQLDGFYLYTGATYRSLALYCIQHNIDIIHDKESVIKALDEIAIDLFDHTVLINNEDVTEALKRADVARVTPKVAAIPEVRKAMVIRQQEIAQQRITEGKIVVIEGRDTATVVFPDAALKVFLTATPEVRARRRLEQYQSQGVKEATFVSVLKDLQQRDHEDTERAADPLVKYPEKHGYFVVDNSSNTEEETVATIIGALQKKSLLA